MNTNQSTAIAASEGLDAIKPPAGTKADDWQHDERGTYRLLYSTNRTVPGRADITVQATAVQLSHGGIDGGTVETPGVHVEVGGAPLTVAQARALAGAIWDATAALEQIAGASRTAMDAHRAACKGRCPRCQDSLA